MLDQLANIAGSLSRAERILILLAILAGMAFAWGLSVWAEGIRPNVVILPPDAERRRRTLARIRAVALPLAALALAASVLYLIGAVAWSTNHGGTRPKVGGAIVMVFLIGWTLHRFYGLPSRPSEP